jgi:hypothetical protein
MNNIGRNDPCPCGSGKKYKKCCIDKPSPIKLARLEDEALGKQRIQEFEEGQNNLFGKSLPIQLK